MFKLDSPCEKTPCVLRFSRQSLKAIGSRGRDANVVIVIECRCRVRGRNGERSDADAVDAGLGQGPYGGELTPPEASSLICGRGGITPAHGLGDVLGPEVVDQDDVGRARERGSSCSSESTSISTVVPGGWPFARTRSRSRTGHGPPAPAASLIQARWLSLIRTAS